MGLIGNNALAVTDKPTEVCGDSLPLGAVKRLRAGTQLSGVVLIYNKVTAALIGILVIYLAVDDKHTKRLDGIPGEVNIDRTDYIVALLYGCGSLLTHDLSAVVGGIHILVRGHDRNIGVGHVNLKNISLVLILTAGVIENIIGLRGTGSHCVGFLRDYAEIIGC